MKRLFKGFKLLWIRRRILAALGGALLCAPFLPGDFAIVTRLLLMWGICAAIYLAYSWQMMLRSDLENIQSRARKEDEGAGTVLILTILAALASLGAIFLELSQPQGVHDISQNARLALVGWTLLSAWSVIHTAFAIHYAHEYHIHRNPHNETHRPLEFPGEGVPLYKDFLHFSFIIGCAAQTADIQIRSSALRWVAMWHSIVAFFFNTSLLALGINLIADLLH